MHYFIKAKGIILAEDVVDGYLEVQDGLFKGIVSQLPPDADWVDYSDYYLGPGLVDTHIHGYMSHDVMDNDREGLKVISQGLLACGVTSWLPTTLTDTTDRLNAVCQTIGDCYHEMPGAKIRGIFLEGPFFTEEYKGAQNPSYMEDPSKDKLEHWDSLSGGLVNKIAIAPEREGALDFIGFAKTLGVETALAHSAASYDQAKAAVEAGARIFVHTFNGMSGLHHRNPGMVGAALTLEGAYAEIICDGYHVHPAAIDVLIRSRGVEETVLITDCMRAGGQGDGHSMLGEFPVEVKDGAARLKSSGSLAGSVLELIQGVQNLLKWGLATLPEAVRMASLNPAKSVGIEGQCGQILPGLEADFIVLDDQGQLQATYLDGVLRYQI